jgi:sugar phosphate permease
MTPAGALIAAFSWKWRLVWALGVAQIACWGALYYSFPLFVEPMERELGWSKTDLNGALTLGLLAAGLAAFPVGMWLDRRGGRLVMSAGSLLGATCLLVWAQVHELWVFYLLWLLLGVAQAATLYEPAFAVIASAFGSDYRRGITSLTLIGGFASTVFVPLAQIFIEVFGWRGALQALAACTVLLGTLVYFLTLRGVSPRPLTSATPANPLANRTVLARAARSPVFWCLVLAFSLYIGAFSVITFHLIPLLLERGVAIAAAVSAIALIGPAQVGGRIVIAALGARSGAREIGRIVVFLLPVATLLLLVHTGDFLWLALFALIYGVGNGCMTIVRSVSVPDLLTRHAYGTLNGTIAMAANLTKAVAPLAAAGIWSLSGGYDAVLWAVFVSASLSALAFWLATILPRGSMDLEA